MPAFKIVELEEYIYSEERKDPVYRQDKKFEETERFTFRDDQPSIDMEFKSAQQEIDSEIKPKPEIHVYTAYALFDSSRPLFFGSKDEQKNLVGRPLSPVSEHILGE